MISCSPQCTQYLVPPRRLIACFTSLHSLMRMASLTTAPQNEQKRTGAFARLWLKLVHLFPCIIILRSLSPSMIMNSREALYVYHSVFSQNGIIINVWSRPFPKSLNLCSSFIPGLINSRCANSWWATWMRELTIYWNTIIQLDCCDFYYVSKIPGVRQYFRLG